MTKQPAAPADHGKKRAGQSFVKTTKAKKRGDYRGDILSWSGIIHRARIVPLQKSAQRRPAGFYAGCPAAAGPDARSWPSSRPGPPRIVSPGSRQHWPHWRGPVRARDHRTQARTWSGRPDRWPHWRGPSAQAAGGLALQQEGPAAQGGPGPAARSRKGGSLSGGALWEKINFFTPVGGNSARQNFFRKKGLTCRCTLCYDGHAVRVHRHKPGAQGEGQKGNEDDEGHGQPGEQEISYC